MVRYLRNTGWILTTILLIAVFLRFYGLGWGLPNNLHFESYNQNELSQLDQVWNIDNLYYEEKLEYPSFNHYIASVLFVFANFLNIINLQSSVNYYLQNPFDLGAIILIGRMISVVFSILSVIVVYWIGSYVYDRKVGLLAALLTAIVPINIIAGHYFLLEPATAFWMILSLLFSLRVVKEGFEFDYWISAIFAGIAGATHYSGFFAYFPLLAAHYIRTKEKKAKIPKVFNKTFFTSLIILIVTFVIFSPYSFADYASFSENMKGLFIQNHVTPRIGVNVASNGFQFNYFIYQIFALLPFILGIPLYLVGLAGILYIMRKWDKDENAVILAYLIPYLIFFSLSNNVIAFDYVALVPVFAVMAAMMVWKTDKAGFHFFSLVFTLTMVIYTGTFAVTFVDKFDDTRDEAYNWIIENIANLNSIAISPDAPMSYNPLFDTKAYDGIEIKKGVVDQRKANDVNNNDEVRIKFCRDSCKSFRTFTMFRPTRLWLKKYNPQYIILSSRDYNKYLRGQGGEETAGFYKWLRGDDSNYKLVKVFEKPYLNQKFYKRLDPAFESYEQSPRIEVYKRI